MEREFGGGLRAVCKGLGGGALVLDWGDRVGLLTWFTEDVFIVDVLEFPESELTLGRRLVGRGIRDWELRLEVLAEVGDDERFPSTPYMFEVGGYVRSRAP